MALPFPWSKYSYLDQLQATNMASLNMELGIEAHNGLSAASTSQLYHTTDSHPPSTSIAKLTQLWKQAYPNICRV